MSQVIEEAVIRILPSFKDFKPELTAGLRAATEGEDATVKVKLQVDARFLHNSVKAAVGSITDTASTVKLRATFDYGQMKRDFSTALGRATESAASSVAAAQVRLDVNRSYLKASLQTGIREAIRQVGLETAGDGGLKVKVEPIIDRRKLDAQLAELAHKTVTVKVRYDVDNPPAGLRAVGGGSGIGTGPEAGRRGGQKGGSGFGRISAEFFNALPGIGGIGPHAAEALVAGIVAGGPAIAAALTAAVSVGLGAGTIAAGIAVAAQDQRVKNAGALLGGQIMGTLSGAAKPLTDELLTVIPQVGADIQALQPKLTSIFSAISPSIGRLETGLLGGLSNALQPQAALNLAQYLDALATKLPAMGAAAGRFLVTVTDPRGVAFFKGLIDFTDKLILSVASLVDWLTKVNEAFTKAGVYTAIGSVVKAIAEAVGGMAHALGPGAAAGIIGVGAAFLLLGGRSKTAGAEAELAAKQVTTGWGEARLALALYMDTLKQGGVGPIQAGRLTGSQLSPGIKSTLGNVAAFGLPLAGSIVGAGLSSSGHQTAGSILSGASGGAFVGGAIGSLFPGPGTIVGAGLGAVVGGLITALNENTAALKASTPQNVATVAGTLAGSGAQNAIQQALHGDDPGLKTFAKIAPGQFTTALEAVNKGDVNTVTDLLQSAKDDKVAAQQGLKAAQFARGHPQDGQKVDPNAEKNAQRRLDNDSKLIALYPGVIEAAQQQSDALDRNSYAIQTTPPWTGTVFEKFQQLITGATPVGIANPFTTSTGLNIAGETQTINTATEAYRNYILAQRGVGDAEYQKQQTTQQTSIANEAALHGVITAEHGLAQAHFATEMAQRSLTEARKEAIANLTELHRQVRDLGDNEESLKIKLVEANLAEQQTRGLDPDSLTRRKAILDQHAAANALSDFQADRPVLLAKAKLADQQGVEGSTAVKQATNALSEAHLNESEQVRNVKLARDSYNNTLQNSQHANELAQRAVDDATYALGQQAAQLALTEAATHLTTDAVKALYENSKNLDRTFNMKIDDGGSTLIAQGNLADLYEGLVQLASVYGIDIAGWNQTQQITPNLPVSPGPGLTIGGPGRKRAAFGDGGAVGGWSPHDRADNIPSWLTADEYVINAKSSRKHRGLLEAINADRHYADGGLVLPNNVPISRWSAPVRANLDQLLGTSGASGSAGNANISSVQNWLRTGADPLPYVFGAVGPTAFDCSGLVGEVWARLTGNPSNRRYFVTGTERDFLTRHGFKDGTGTFTVGFSGEHTMGSLGGVPFEAANPRSGIHVGSGTSDVTKFPNVMYLPEFGDRFVGGGGYPPDVSAVTVGGLFGSIMRKILTDAKKAADARSGGGDSGLADAADANVAQIAYNTARSMGVDNKSLLALFEAGIVESGMKNLNYGDRDSLGFLQQRASWGSVASRENVADSARRFLSRAAGKSANATTAGRLAQSVQVSAFPDRYDNARNAAVALLRRLDPTIQFGTYDSGGWLTDVGFNTGGKPEAVLNPEESRAYVRHAQAVSGQGGEMRLDEWTIARLAQAMSTRPIPVHMDGRKVADAVVPHLERRF